MAGRTINETAARKRVAKPPKKKATDKDKSGNRVRLHRAEFAMMGPPIYLQSLQNAVIRYIGVDDVLASFLEFQKQKPSVQLLYDSRPDHGESRAGPFPQPVVRAIRAPRGVKEFLLHVQVWNNPRNAPPNPWAVHYEVGELVQGSFIPIHVGDYQSPERQIGLRWVLHVTHNVVVATA